MRSFLLLITALSLCVWPQATFAMDMAEQAFGKSPIVKLARVVQAGNIDLVKTLIAQGVDIKEVGQDGMTITHFALLARKNQPEIMEAVLAAGADPVSLLSSGQSVPLFAVMRDDADPRVVAVLLKHGIRPNWRASEGDYMDFSLLGGAARGRNLPVMRLLVREGADINYAASVGGSALHSALIHPDFFMAAFLVESGIDLDILDDYTSENIEDLKVKPKTAIEYFCHFQGGKRGHNPLPEIAGGWKVFTASLAKRGVPMPCDL